MRRDVQRDAKRYAEVVAAMRAMSDTDLLRVHREACRLAQPIYARIYAKNYAAGVASAEARRATVAAG